MPDSPIPGRRRARAGASLAWIALLAACSGPPATQAQAQLDEAPDAAAVPVLQCMPNALVPLQLPVAEGLALEHDDLGTGTATAECVLALFGDGTLKTPLAFDLGYAPVFSFHEEDGTLTLGSIPRNDMQLFRLGEVPGARIWLLRIDTGIEPAGSRYDLLFSTDLGSGRLVDHLLVGAMGLMYRRDYDIDGADAFAIREDSGRGDLVGPGYRARYAVQPDGRFTLLSSRRTPASAAADEAQAP